MIPFGTDVIYITRYFLISHVEFSLSDRRDGHGVKMGTDKHISDVLNSDRKTNGKPSTWNFKE